MAGRKKQQPKTDEQNKQPTDPNQDPFRVALGFAMAGKIAPDHVEAAIQKADKMRTEIAAAENMKEGKFNDEGEYIPLSEDAHNSLLTLYNAMKNTILEWQKLMMSEEVQQLKQNIYGFAQWLTSSTKNFDLSDIVKFLELAKEWQPVLPYLAEEMQEIQKTLGIEQEPFADFLQAVDEDGQSYFHTALRNAWERLEAAKAAEELLNNLPRLQSTIPQKHLIPNNALANSLHGEIGSGENARTGDLTVGHKGNQEIKAFVSLSYEPDAGVNIKNIKFTEFDRQVHNTVLSLYRYGDPSHIATPAIVARTMMNKQDGSTLSPQIIEKTAKSLEKQRRTDTEIDATEEITSYLKSRGTEVPEGTTFHWRDFLLPLRPLDVRSGKTKLSAYFIKETPILLHYTELTGQLTTVDAKLLDIKEVDQKTGKPLTTSIPNTEARIVIKGYLLRRVEVIKHDYKKAKDALRKYNERRKHNKDLEPKTLDDFRNQSSVILFSTMFEETDLQDVARNQEKRNRDYAITVLDYWKALKHIDGYHLRKAKGRGNPIDAIVIDFNS